MLENKCESERKRKAGSIPEHCKRATIAEDNEGDSDTNCSQDNTERSQEPRKKSWSTESERKRKVGSILGHRPRVTITEDNEGDSDTNLSKNNTEQSTKA